MEIVDYNLDNIYCKEKARDAVTREAKLFLRRNHKFNIEDIDELPENCNLTDAKIMVNSKKDIDKFKLNEFVNNVFIKQDSIINGEVIDLDFNDYFNLVHL